MAGMVFFRPTLADARAASRNDYRPIALMGTDSGAMTAVAHGAAVQGSAVQGPAVQGSVVQGAANRVSIDLGSIGQGPAVPGPAVPGPAGSDASTTASAPALSATDASATTYLVRETRSAGSARAVAHGALWHAGILEELAAASAPRPGGSIADRVLCSSGDVERWLAARRRGVTATDAARLATPASVRAVVHDKRDGGHFGGNAFTEYGRRREPVIAEWMRAEHGIGACGLLFRSAEHERHLATPDGFAERDGAIVLAEIKTTNKTWKSIPRNYLRQVWWQQYVCGAERTLFVWERHTNFVVTDPEPQAMWIDRDETEIAKLVVLADAVLERLDYGS